MDLATILWIAKSIFSKGVRGEFYGLSGELLVPVYLNPNVLRSLREIADRKGVPLNDLVNDLHSKELTIVEALR